MAEFVHHNLDLMSQFEQLNGSVTKSFNLGLTGFSNENFLPFLENIPSTISPVESTNPDIDVMHPACSVREQGGDRERKVVALSETNSMNSSAVTSTETKKKKKKKKKKNRSRGGNRERVEDPKEVVHVRARRGQATDSHSLAERVRREKINERMRYLQDLVPGCYKTMGMAGMLDEIINYVQSLQKQVEFLSMKLSAASSYYDFSLDMEAMTAQQMLPRDGYAYLQSEAVERLVREHGYGECTRFQSTLPC